MCGVVWCGVVYTLYVNRSFLANTTHNLMMTLNFMEEMNTNVVVS